MRDKNRAWIYTRVDTQDKNDIALELHETQLRRYALEQGYNVVGSSADTASGNNLNRSGLNQIGCAVSMTPTRSFAPANASPRMLCMGHSQGFIIS